MPINFNYGPSMGTYGQAVEDSSRRVEGYDRSKDLFQQMLASKKMSLDTRLGEGQLGNQTRAQTLAEEIQRRNATTSEKAQATSQWSAEQDVQLRKQLATLQEEIQKRQVAVMEQDPVLKKLQMELQKSLEETRRIWQGGESEKDRALQEKIAQRDFQAKMSQLSWQIANQGNTVQLDPRSNSETGTRDIIYGPGYSSGGYISGRHNFSDL